MTTLKKQGAKSFLFDLRGNPGGLLPGGIETASLFLESNKPVVFVVSNKGVVSAEETFADGIDTTTPITVLVDHNTASAAEVFTAALKENGRATIVGEQTFGKGIIQTIRELSDQNGGVAVTVARYETPNHNDINKAGIAVDETTNVDCAKDDATACVPSKLLL
jgi:carboxyl-terminal processing protease